MFSLHTVVSRRWDWTLTCVFPLPWHGNAFAVSQTCWNACRQNPSDGPRRLRLDVLPNGQPVRLRAVSDRIKKDGIKILFTETDFPSPFAGTLRKETGVKTFGLSHLSQGDYRADFFERAIKNDLDTLTAAVKAVSGGTAK